MSLREIGEKIGLPSPVNPQKIKHHIDQLTRRGIVVSDKKNKSIKLKRNTQGPHELYSIPIYGEANCGRATILSIQNLEGYLKVSKSYLPSSISVEKLFALRAVGNSMNSAKIRVVGKKNENAPISDGDYVIINSEDKTPQDGKYILSIIDNCANIKIMKLGQSNEVMLLSESTEKFPPIFIHENDQPDYLINGTVVGVLKVNK